jgi:hypothetical protein
MPINVGNNFINLLKQTFSVKGQETKKSESIPQDIFTTLSNLSSFINRAENGSANTGQRSFNFGNLEITDQNIRESSARIATLISQGETLF